MNEDPATSPSSEEIRTAEAPVAESAAPTPEMPAPEESAPQKAKTPFLVRVKALADKLPANCFPADGSCACHGRGWRAALVLLVLAWLFRLSLVPQAVAVILLGLGALYLALAAIRREPAGAKAPVAPVVVGVLALCAVVCPGSFRTGAGASADMQEAADQAQAMLADAQAQAGALAGGADAAKPSKKTSAKDAAKTRKAAEKLVLDFVAAAAKADFQMTDKMIPASLMQPNDLQTWGFLKQEIEGGMKVEDPSSIFLACTFEVFHHPKVDEQMAKAEEQLAAQFPGACIVVAKATPKLAKYEGKSFLVVFTVLSENGKPKVVPVPNAEALQGVDPKTL